MSRVAKAPIELPKNVEFNMTDGLISIKGPKGTLTQQCHKNVELVWLKNNEKFYFKPSDKAPDAWAMAGTMRALVNNMVKGVIEVYTVTLELVGVGYRVQAKNQALSLSLGFSHPIEYEIPQGIALEIPNNTTIVLKGIDKQKLGQVAAEIRAFRPPEPYKGKGVKYSNEVIVRKEAKKK